MNTLLKQLTIDYLAVEKTAEIDTMINDKFARLKQVCNNIQTCQVKIANTARYKATASKCSYLVSVSLRLSDGVDLYTLRLPLVEKDSINVAIADAFAKIYRQLIELQLEQKYIVPG